MGNRMAAIAGAGLATLALVGGLGVGLAGPAGAQDAPVADKSEIADASLHFQATSVVQFHPAFRAPYSGENSLFAGREAKESLSATVFMGTRLWRGAELYLNPEFFHGFGLSQTHGLAGYANGEAQKAGTKAIDSNFARAFLRQTFGFGGETEVVKDGPNQIAGIRDVSRLTVTIGKMSVTDIFNDNAYAHDARTTFLNWSIWEAGAFDYAADQLGYTKGIVFELNQKRWAVRLGYYQKPVEANAQLLDPNLLRRGSYVGELEQRYEVMGQPGKLRLLAFFNRQFSGDWREALEEPAAGGRIEPTRKTRTQIGFGINIEQALTQDLGFFSRLSWNDGKTESFSFTDIDKSVSLGLSLKGTAWRRPDDTVGIAAALNGISGVHARWFASGGSGLLIGDGRLNYAGERVGEAYYAASLGRGWTGTLNYQYFGNPAFNADRGPVSVYTTRLHFEY